MNCWATTIVIDNKTLNYEGINDNSDWLITYQSFLTKLCCIRALNLTLIIDDRTQKLSQHPKAAFAFRNQFAICGPRFSPANVISRSGNFWLANSLSPGPELSKIEDGWWILIDWWSGNLNFGCLEISGFSNWRWLFTSFYIYIYFTLIHLH